MSSIKANMEYCNPYSHIIRGTKLVQSEAGAES